MNTIYRYILREHIGPFLFGFFVITFILIIDWLLEVMDLLIRKGIGVRVIFELFFLNLAWMIALSVPMAILVAALMAFGRLSADNEITAIKAGGVSLYRLVCPVLAASLVVAALLVIFNDRVLPEFNHRARNLMSAIHRKRPVLSLKDKEGMFITDLPGYSMLIEKVDQRHSRIYGVTIYERKGTASPVSIRAKRGEAQFSDDKDLLTLILYDGEVHQIDEEDPNRYIRTKFRKHVVHISGVGSTLYRSDSEYRGDREMSSGMMLEKVAEYRREIKAHERKIDNIAREYISRYLPESIDEDYLPPPTALEKKLSRCPENQGMMLRLKNELREIEIRKRNINKYLVEVHKKYSIPAACIVFVLIGGPLGIMVKRGGIAVGFGISIGFFVLYWVFLIGGEDLADRMLISPALAMWAPNVLIGGTGIYLIIYCVKEMTFIRWEQLKGIRLRRKH